VRAPLLDDIDRRIIAQLQQNGRRPYTAIAKDVGLSEAGVRQRVARLLRNRVIQIVAASSPLELGLMQAEVGITVRGDRVMPIAEELAALPEVDFVAVSAGSFDVIIGLVCRDQAELLDLLTERIRTIAGVDRAEVFVYLKTLKDSYQWSPIAMLGPPDRR
jgi:Lrp/AsnC family transcriptional regulator, regulator for asnA, asnC and gidA